MVDKALRQELIDNWGIDQSTGELRFLGAGANDSLRLFVANGTPVIQKLVAGVWETTSFDVSKLNFEITISEPGYKAGQGWYDAVSKGHVLDTGYDPVRLNVGRETHREVYNDTGTEIPNGTPVSVTGVITGITPNIIKSSSSSILSVLAFAGVTTMAILDGEKGLVTNFGTVSDVDTSLLELGSIYLGPTGGYTQTKPLYPEERLIIGGVTKVGESGILSIGPRYIQRRSASRSYSFTSASAAAGLHWRAGFYDWDTSDVSLSQGSLSVTYGTADATRAAHVGIVPSAAGIVDTGQVGLQVTGTQDAESGIQVADQTAIITDDITTLTVDIMEECLEKFSGNVEISLYVVSGSPVNYSVTFNYGFSKYEDFANIDGTVTGFSAVWEAGANDTEFDITLMLHSPTGWTYAATGFDPGNGDICRRSVDQAIASGINTGLDGAYKRTGLSTFVDGTAKEGVIVEIKTGEPNSIRSMDLHISAFSEELF